MAQNIVLCFDGTNNEFGPNNTNVVRLVQALDRDRQQLYYDPGVGTLPDPRVMGRICQRLSEWFDLAFATGLEGKIQAAYTYLMDFWEPGAKVYIFGFSRGAYTARVLAGMLHLMGLLSRGNHDLVPYVMRLFGSIRGKRAADLADPYWHLCHSFRQTFARQTDNDARHFRVQFLGLWDTVSSVGWVWEPKSYVYTASNPSVINARHAISIDERRAFFRQNRLNVAGAGDGQNWKEQWFPGVHCDVGGGYPENEGGLWLVAFDWMVKEAQSFDLLINPERLNQVRNHGNHPAPSNPWSEPAHESLVGFWKVVEYFPKQHWEPGTGYTYRANLGRPRAIRAGDVIHESALRRVQAGNYKPGNFSDNFIARVTSLNPVPESLPYDE